MAMPATVTGPNINGWTSPAFTLLSDSAFPDAKQFYVSAISAASGVSTHSVSSPFTISYWRVSTPAPAPRLQGNGVLVGVQFNKFKVVIRKGCTVLSGQPPAVAVVSKEYRIPSGSDTADLNNIAGLVAFEAAVESSSASDKLNLLTKNVMTY